MRTLDFHRGLVTLLAAAVAGGLLWLAGAYVGTRHVGPFWASMGIVAGAGLVMALSQVLGGWTKWGRPRISAGTFLLGFLPVFVCTAWILVATQPGHGWQEGRLVGWSHSIGLYGIVHALGLYHGALALGVGLALGLTLDTRGARREELAVDRPAVAPVTTPLMDRTAADEPVAAERSEISAHRNVDALVGVHRGSDRQVEIREDGKRVVPQAPDPDEAPAGMD
jgi:hypothetical protein